MSNIDASKKAGQFLRRLIQENYSSQEGFAFDFGAELRTINRYVNNGINKVNVIQELAEFFNVDVLEFFQ